MRCFFSVAGAISIVLLGGCSKKPPVVYVPKERDSLVRLHYCSEPRPEICTMDYRPVCGTLKEGTFSTFANGCAACADDEVAAYVEGACPGEPTR